MYTEEKKAALIKALGQQIAVHEATIRDLHSIGDYLCTTIPLSQIPLKEKLNNMLSNINYQLALSRSFKKELE